MADHTSKRQPCRPTALPSSNQQRGSVLLTALGMSIFVCLMMFMSAIWIQSRIGQVLSSSNKMDHRIVLDGLFAYTVNGIKQSWCFSSTWVQDNACDLFHARNTVRLLLSDETLMFLGSSKTKHPEPVIATRISKMTQTVTLGQISLEHPLYGITKSARNNYSSITFTIERNDSAISSTKGREIPLRVTIKMPANPGSPYKDMELESKIIVYPRELSYFGLVMANDLYLGISTPPTTGKADIAMPSVATRSTAGLRFESPIYVNGSVHLPAKTASAAQAMTNVIFLDKVVIGGGLVYQGAGTRLFSPPNAGGQNNMYNHDMTSFSGLLAGYELDPQRDMGLNKLFNVKEDAGPLVDFQICRKRVMASFDLSITKDSQLFTRFNGAPSANNFNLSASMGNIDNLVEQYPETSGATDEILTSVPMVNMAGKVVSWTGGAVFKARIIYEGLKNPVTGVHESFFTTFYIPRRGQIELYPMGPGTGKPVITVTSSAHQVSGKEQYNEVDMNVTFANVGALDLGNYLTGSVYTTNSVKMILEGMDYGYNYATNIRNSDSIHPVMKGFKINGFTFFKTPAGAMDVQRMTAGAWYNNSMLTDDEVNMPTYDKLQKPVGETDWTAFDARCMVVPGNSDSYYMSFPSADWSTSFVDQARHAWSFDPDPTYTDGYFDGTKYFDANNSLYPSPFTTFKISSLIKVCSIEASANFVTGFYGCEKLVIKPRGAPLRIIGTFLVGDLVIDPSAYQAGIRWSSIYHPQAVFELRKAGILGKDKAGVKLNCDDPNLPPLWMPNIGAISAMTHYVCNPVSLRVADPFKWTTVDPDCGVPPGEVKIACKRATKRFLIKEVGRTKGL